MTRTVGLLHTVPALAPSFDALVAEHDGELRRVHVADAWLLATARVAGVTAAVQDAVTGHLRRLADSGAEAVLVTCSSIGEAAEHAAEQMAVPIVRVDAAMAAAAVERAAAGAGRIAVLATLESTLGPTRRLVARAASGRAVSITSTVVPGAAERADAGDRAAADALITAAAVRTTAVEADVIVLAQASMAGAADAAATGVPVLTSPAGGVRALLAALDPTRPL